MFFKKLKRSFMKLCFLTRNTSFWILIFFEDLWVILYFFWFCLLLILIFDIFSWRFFIFLNVDTLNETMNSSNLFLLTILVFLFFYFFKFKILMLSKCCQFVLNIFLLWLCLQSTVEMLCLIGFLNTLINTCIFIYLVNCVITFIIICLNTFK